MGEKNINTGHLSAASTYRRVHMVRKAPHHIAPLSHNVPPRIRFPCEPGPPRCSGKRETRRIAGLMRPPTLSLPRGPPWPAPFCNQDRGWVYIEVASYLPRRERWPPTASRVAAGLESAGVQRTCRDHRGARQEKLIAFSSPAGTEVSPLGVLVLPYRRCRLCGTPARSRASDDIACALTAPFLSSVGDTRPPGRPRLHKTCHRWNKGIVWMAYPNRPLADRGQRNLQASVSCTFVLLRQYAEARGCRFWTGLVVDLADQGKKAK